jgi:putative IMPACT (imprinted ancient) family translation regulator
MPYTLVGFCEYREEIRKSRFITLAAPITSPAEAQAFIEQHSDLDATHNCWAGGTAGRPILAAIQAQACDQVVVLVIRWYGGIQLGTGGLARAYGGGANKCLQNAEKVELISRVSLQCVCGFAELALVKLRTAECGGVVNAERFTANGVELQLAVGEEHIETLQARLADLSRGQIRLERETP